MSEDQDVAMSEWPTLQFNGIAMSGPELQLRAMSVIAAPLQPGSVLMSSAPVARVEEAT